MKMYEKMAKIHLHEQCYNFGPNLDIFIEILYNSFKASSYVM